MAKVGLVRYRQGSNDTGPAFERQGGQQIGRYPVLQAGNNAGCTTRAHYCPAGTDAD